MEHVKFRVNEHETINLQPVGGRLKRLTACLLKNEPATYS